MVKEVLRDWKSLSHAKLFELVGPATHDGAVKAYLSRPAILGRQYGRCFWDPELVEQDAEAERTGRHLPRPSGAPRLFLSYRWTYDDDDVRFWVEEVASATSSAAGRSAYWGLAISGRRLETITR
jgi:hypothetical protein